VLHTSVWGVEALFEELRGDKTEFWALKTACSPRWGAWSATETALNMGKKRNCMSFYQTVVLKSMRNTGTANLPAQTFATNVQKHYATKMSLCVRIKKWQKLYESHATLGNYCKALKTLW